jgi:hypothetical protein
LVPVFFFLSWAKKGYAGDWCWGGVQRGQFCAYGPDVAPPSQRQPQSGHPAIAVALLLRYALLAIPLILAVRSDRFNFPATAVGIFMVQLVIMIEHGSRLIFAAVKH